MLVNGGLSISLSIYILNTQIPITQYSHPTFYKNKHYTTIKQTYKYRKQKVYWSNIFTASKRSNQIYYLFQTPEITYSIVRWKDVLEEKQKCPSNVNILFSSIC